MTYLAAGANRLSCQPSHLLLATPPPGATGLRRSRIFGAANGPPGRGANELPQLRPHPKPRDRNDQRARWLRRHRICSKCRHKFSTLEQVAQWDPTLHGYVSAAEERPALAAVPDHFQEPAKKVAATARHQANFDEDCLVNVCAEAQPLLLQWWNESRKSKHHANATWTKAAWEASVQRVSALPSWQQVLLAQAGVEHGWQALKTEYLKQELTKPTGEGRPMPKDPAMLAALESWPKQTA